MMPTKNQHEDDAAQSAAFVKKARELEADGDYSAADKLIGKLVKMKPEPRTTAPARPAAKPRS